MPNSIAYIQNYTTMLDRVYQRESVSGCLTSGPRMVRAGRNAREIMIPKIEVTGLGDYTRNVGYQTGSITYEYETKTFNFLPNSGESRKALPSTRVGRSTAGRLSYTRRRHHSTSISVRSASL